MGSYLGKINGDHIIVIDGKILKKNSKKKIFARSETANGSSSCLHFGMKMVGEEIMHTGSPSGVSDLVN